jgi:Protein of unknown function (DUF1761)
MSFETLGDLNWLAVIAATLAYFFLGAIWYARPVFGRAWSEASGVQVPEGERPSPAFYIIPLVASLLASVATAMLALSTGTDTIGEGIVLGLVVGVGYALAITLLGLFEPKPNPQGVVLDRRRLSRRRVADRRGDREPLGLGPSPKLRPNVDSPAAAPS